MDIQEKATSCFLIGMENIKHHGAAWYVYLSVLSWHVKFGTHTDREKNYILCVIFVGERQNCPYKQLEDLLWSQVCHIDTRCKKADTI